VGSSLFGHKIKFENESHLSLKKVKKIYIELDYGALQSTKVLCTLHSIFNYKSEMIDPSRSI
jgi:hypothetical protein